jgi:hypothetical protein
MNYEPILSPDAEKVYLGLPPLVQCFLDRELEELAADPIGKLRGCKESHPFLKISTMLIVEESVYDSSVHQFFIVYRFSPCERYMQILVIGITPPYDNDPPGEPIPF